MVSERTPITDLPIHTFQPKQDGQPWLAFIGSVGTLPIYFRGPTEFAAFAAASNDARNQRRRDQAAEADRGKPLTVSPASRPKGPTTPGGINATR